MQDSGEVVARSDYFFSNFLIYGLEDFLAIKKGLLQPFNIFDARYVV
ncbi:hypothetical protein BH09BAC4_BH09BAC4_26080 [soil metagenome]